MSRVLGEGTHGRVFLVHTPGLNTYRAVKMLKPGFTQENFRRFQEEAKVYARLSNPRIVTLHGTGIWKESLPYLEMEFVDGPSLEELLREHKTLPPAVALSLAIQVAEALEYAAHAEVGITGGAKGVIHRDVKPGNILFTREGEPKLVDFGLARIGPVSTHTVEARVPGTMPYMAPEQHDCDIRSIDHRTDIFALGIVLVECLTGKRPFPEGNLEELIHAKKQEQLAMPEAWERGLPEGLPDIIRKCLKSHPQKRWSRYRALILALRSSLEEMTGRSPESILREYIQDPGRFFLITAEKKPKQQRARIVAWVAGVLLILGGVLIILWWWKQSNPGIPAKENPIRSSEEFSSLQIPSEPSGSSGKPKDPGGAAHVAKVPGKTSSGSPGEKASTPRKDNRIAPPREAQANLPPEPTVANPADIVESDPWTEASEAYQRGEWKAVIDHMRKVEAGKLSKPMRDRRSLMLLEAYVREENLTEAAKLLTPEQNLWDAHYWFWAATIYIGLNQYAKAEVALEKAVKLPTIMDSDVLERAHRKRVELLTQLSGSGRGNEKGLQEAVSSYRNRYCGDSRTPTEYCRKLPSEP